MRHGKTPIEAVLLGTAGAFPSREKHLPSTIVRTRDITILVDAGEGAQYRLREAGYSGHEIDLILITHIHGDHVFGIPGLLQGLSLTGRTRPLAILGPPGTAEYIKDVFRHTRFAPLYPVKIYELSPYGSIVAGKRTIISWVEACHTVDSRAYRISYIKPPSLNPILLEKHGLKGAIISTLLERGEYRGVTLRQVAKAPAKEYSITLTGDTAPCARIAELAYGTDILVHDSTYDSSLRDRAHEQGHSTALDAAQTASAAEARLLVLVHTSARYHDPETDGLPGLVYEAQKIHPSTILGHDLMRLQVKPSWGRSLGYVGLESLGLGTRQEEGENEL